MARNVSNLEDFRKWFPHLAFLEKNKDKIAFLNEMNKDFDFEPFHIDVVDGKLALVWNWEDDNGLYSYSGAMEAIYDIKKKDDTWSYGETQSLLEGLGLENSNVTSFRDLINNLNIESCKNQD